MNGGSGSWKISNLIRSNRLEGGGGGGTEQRVSESNSSVSSSQPGSGSSSAGPSPARTARKGINLLPEVVSCWGLQIFGMLTGSLISLVLVC